MLAMEERKLDALKEAGQIDAERYGREKEVMAARKAAMEQEAAERRKEIEGANAVGRLRRQEESARDEGRTAEASAYRRLADDREDALTREAARREAEGMKMTREERRSWVEQQVRENKAERERKRAADERAKALDRAESTTGQRGAVGSLQEQLERMRGNGRKADEMRERQARERDQVDRERARRSYVDQGFDAKTAKRMADTDVKTAQANRLMESLTGQRSAVVASSLAEIGGGGGTYGGQDKQTQIMEKMAKALEDIRDQGRENIGIGGML